MTTNPAHLDDAPVAANQPAPAAQSSAITLRPSPELAADVDLLLKANEIDKALDVVDRHVLIDGLGWSPDVVAQCRSAWVALRGRRTKRGSR